MENLRHIGKKRSQQDSMKIEVLVSTMGQKSIDFYKKLNIKSDCLIINQTDHESYEEVYDKENKIRMISTKTRGLGRSRNLGLLNSKADVIVCAMMMKFLKMIMLKKLKVNLKTILILTFL